MCCISLPWNQETPIGYIAEMVFGIIAVESLQIVLYSSLAIFISICFHHAAFNEMFKYKLREFELPEIERNNGKIVKDLIQFHTAAKA